MDRLKESLLEAPVVEKEGYHYFVHPITDGVPMLRPELLREVVVGIVRTTDLSDVDKIVTPAAMGIHISTAVSLATDVPLVVLRKRSYGFDDEVALAKQTGYAESEIYINGVEAGDRVLVLDDVLSTGGTLDAITAGLEHVGVDIADIVVVIHKVDGNDNPVVGGYEVTSLIDIEMDGGNVVVRE